MPPVVSHVLLALAIAAGAGASVRVASTAVPRGLGRAVAATVVWGALVVAQTLALGLAALGGSAIALTVAAGLAWLASRAALPEPATTLREDLAAAWAGLDRRGRALAAALGGVAAMWTVWLLFYPALGVDGTMYHLPEALSWVRNGRPGSSSALLYDLPVDSYPLTDEVLRAWGTAIGESFVWSTFVTPAGAILALAAGWLGLRAVRIDRAAAALALVALAATPVFVIQLNTTSTDMTALAWLASCAALSAAHATMSGQAGVTARRWSVLAAGFFALMLDERFALHERLRDGFLAGFGIGLPWGAPGDYLLAILLVAGLIALPWLWPVLASDPLARRLFIVAVTLAGIAVISDTFDVNRMTLAAERLQQSLEEVVEALASACFAASMTVALLPRLSQPGPSNAAGTAQVRNG